MENALRSYGRNLELCLKQPCYVGVTVILSNFILLCTVTLVITSAHKAMQTCSRRKELEELQTAVEL